MYTSISQKNKFIKKVIKEIGVVIIEEEYFICC